MSIQGSQLRIAPKNPVRVATTGDVTLSGGAPDTLDGVSLAVNDRILVWQQSAGAENGIYRVQTLGTGSNGTWVRTEDYDTVIQDHIEAGLNTYVQEGTRHGGKTFILTTTGAIVIGTTATTFADISDKNSVAVVRAGGASSTDLNSDTGFAFFNMTTSATETVNLPPADDVQGRQIFILFEGDGTGSVTLDGFGAETVNGGATYSVTQGDMVMLNSLGSSTGFGATVINNGGGGGLSGNTGGTDNVLLRADGTGGSTVQASNTTLDDSSNMAGLASLSMNEQSATPASAAGTGVFYVSDEAPSVGVFLDDVGTTRIFAKASDGIVYVGKHGDNANDGYSEANAVLTIATALTQASALTPSTSNRIEIRILGGGTYSESVTLPNFVSLNAPEATLDGNLSVGSDCRVRLHRATDSSSAPTVAVSTAGERWIAINDIDNTGTGNAFSVSIASATVHLDVGQMAAAAATTFIATAGQIYGRVGLVSITGANNGIQLSSGGTADARLRGLVVGHIDDDGTGTGIRHENAFTQELSVGNLDASTIYDVTNASGVLNLFVGEVTGSAGTVTGTANVTEAGAGGGGGLAGSTGATDNALLRADGTGGSTVQSSGVTLDDSANVAGVVSITLPEQTSAPVTPGSANGTFWVKQTDGTVNTNIPMFTDEDSIDMALVRSVELQRSMPASTGDSVELGTISVSNGQVLGISVFGGPASSSDYVAYHRVVLRSAASTGGFQILRPLYTSGPTDGSTFNDKIQIEIDVAVGGLISLRARSYFGVAGDIRVRLIFDGDDRGAFTSSSTQATTTPPTDNFGPNMLTMAEAIGNLSIGYGIVTWQPFYFQERASANGNVAGYGQLWVRNDSPNTLVFTDDSGTDKDLLAGNIGATDNAVLRADGTGGATPQGSSILIDDAGVLSPSTDDSGSLGSASLKWSDLFVASGGVLNFNSGDVTVTHSAGALLFAGGTAGYDFDNPFFLTERAAALSSQAGKGQLWVRNDTPNVLVFTDDTGADTVLGAGGGGASSPVKAPARLATTSNIANLATGAPDTVDGVTVVASDRILVWNQTSADENGVYVVDVVGTGSNGQWSRATDFDDASADSIVAGVEIYVQEGDSGGQVKFILTSTGTLTIGSSNLDFVPMGGLVRSEGTSTEIQASTTFTTAFKYTSTVNMRDYNELAVYFDPITLGGNTDVNIIIQWSDDGTTVAFADGEYTQVSDFNITTNTDGSFNPKTYTANLTTAGGELAAGQGVHLSFPKRGGVCRIGVQGDVDAVGSYTVRAQRLVV